MRRAYAVAELGALLREPLGLAETPVTPLPSAAPASAPLTVTPPAAPARTAAPVIVSQAQPTPEPTAPPRCPQCATPMVLRTASRGANQGEQFWGCPDYPRCRGIVKAEA